jgi:hypothetical protein
MTRKIPFCWILVQAECMRCPDALQKVCQADVVATINGVIFSFSPLLL